MLFGRSLQFRTPEDPKAALALLSSVTLSPGAIAPLHPVPVKEWVEQHVGRRFVGTVEGSRFKLALLPTMGSRFYVRRSVVVIVGEVEGHNVLANLRPPVFISLFLVAFTVAVTAALVLSFFGPADGYAVQLLLASALVLPTFIVVLFFRREASLAEKALRLVLRCP